MNKELEDLMMYMIGFAPRLDSGIFGEVYHDNQHRWSAYTVNKLIDMCNEEWGMDIKYVEEEFCLQ